MVVVSGAIRFAADAERGRGCARCWPRGCTAATGSPRRPVRSPRRGPAGRTRRPGRQPRVVRAWLPPLVVAAVTALWTGALASWWSTFGWIAWGPRLTLPLIPALVVAAVRTARSGLDAGLSWLLGATWRAVVVGAVLVVLAVGQVGVVWNQAAIALPDRPGRELPGAEARAGRHTVVLLRLRSERSVAAEAVVAVGGVKGRAGHATARPRCSRR